MQNSVFKITVFFVLAMVFASCDHDDFDSAQVIDEDSFQYKTISVYCQINKNEEISTKSFKRNAEGNVVEEITSRDGKPDNKITRIFQSSGLQKNDSTFYFFEGNWKLQGATQMNYSSNNLTEKLFYGSDGICRNKTVYTYENDKLKWEDHFYFNNNHWGFQYGYKHEFDRNGNMVKKESFQTAEKDYVYDTFLYEYKNGKLVEEKRVIITGATSYIIKYSYNHDGSPDEKIQDGNVIEKNYYSNGRLTEKHTFYFGIDPGFYQCNGNFIYKYEY